MGEIRGKPHYMSYWITLKGKPYNGIEDLRGKPIAFLQPHQHFGFPDTDVGPLQEGPDHS